MILPIKLSFRYLIFQFWKQFMVWNWQKKRFELIFWLVEINLRNERKKNCPIIFGDWEQNGRIPLNFGLSCEKYTLDRIRYRGKLKLICRVSLRIQATTGKLGFWHWALVHKNTVANLVISACIPCSTSCLVSPPCSMRNASVVV